MYYLSVFLLSAFLFNQNHSLSFDGVDDFVLLPSSLSQVGETGKQATLIIEYNGKGDIFQGADWIPNYPQLFRVSESVPSHDEIINIIKTYHRSEDNSVSFEPAVDIPYYDEFSINTLIVSFDNLNGHYSLFFNGQLLIDYSFTPTSFSNSDMVWIVGRNGNLDSGGDNHLNGFIKEMKIVDGFFGQNDVNNYLSSTDLNNLSYIANWVFNGESTSTLYDISGNNHHGTINGATWVENIQGCTNELAENYNSDATIDDGSCEYPDITNYSLSFDGIDDWIEAENINLTGHAFTIQTWIKISPVNFPEQTNIIDAYEVSGDNRRWGIYIGGTNDHDGKVAVSGPAYLMSNERIDDNEWHHVAMTRDSSGTWSLFIDGILNATDNADINFDLNNGHSIKIGSGHNFFGRRFMECTIDEIQISFIDRYQSNFNPSRYFDIDEHTILSYKFMESLNDGVPNIAIDVSGNENHGNIFGGASLVENIEGCTDELACNYYETANFDDGSCIFPDLCGICNGNNESCEIISDSDGNEYGTVIIGNYIWMKQNLNVSTSRACYDDLEVNCAIYGGLYQFDDIMHGENYSEQVDGICPEGWYLPSLEDFQELANFVDNSGNVLKAISEIGATDNLFGFSALLAGMVTTEQNYINLGSSTHFITSSLSNFNNSNSFVISDTDNIGFDSTFNFSGYGAGSVRCVKDYDDPDLSSHLVPQEFSTIQEAIDHSSDGDTVLVSSGTYNENLDSNGKNLNIIGSNKETVIINGNGGIALNINLQETVFVSNLTMRGGRGIVISSSSSAVIDNVILEENNYSNGEGAGLFVNENGSVIISNSIIRNNTSNRGGGAFLENSNAEIKKCVFYNNHASVGGGAIYSNSSDIIIDGATIACNKIDEPSQGGSSIDVKDTSSTTFVKNSIIQYNTGGTLDIDIQGESWWYYNNCEDADCTTWNNSNNTNLNSDPMFINLNDCVEPDLNLQFVSPCVDSGDPSSELDPDGTRADMGAYPFFQIPGCTDELACNYSSDADISDDSCDYSCHDNGDYSLNFDGIDDYISGIGTSLDVSDENRLTFFAKINPNLPQNFPNGTIFTHTADGSTQNQYSVRLSPDGKLYFVTGGSIGSPGSFEDDGVGNLGTIILNENELHSIAITYDGETLKFYVNGSLGYQNNVNDYFSSDYIGNFFIGKQGTNSAFYNGKVSQLAVWNRALSQEELALISNDEIVHETNLLGYWKFNQGPNRLFSNRLIDHSGNGNHGTINGPTWVELIEGCTDELVENYNSDANVDDGSCEYPINDNYSLSFDGIDDYVVIGNDEIFDNLNLNNISIYTSINLDGYESSASCEEQDSNSQFLSIIRNDGSYNLMIKNRKIYAEFFNDTGFEWIESHISLDLNTEYNLIIEKINNTTSLTLNGINIGYTSGHINFPQVLGTFSIGRSPIYCQSFNGKISDIKILSNQTLKADWKFGSLGELVFDHSGNQNHGTIYGATWVENIEGCTDELAENYNLDATIDDGSCEYSEIGDYSLKFDGIDDFSVSNSINLDNSDFTIGLSMKLDSDLLNNSNLGVIFHSKNDNSIEGGNLVQGYYLRFQGNELYFALNNWGIPESYQNGGGHIIDLSHNQEQVNIFDDNFHQIVIKYDKVNRLAQLYIDGNFHDEHIVPVDVTSSFTGNPLYLFSFKGIQNFQQAELDYLFFSNSNYSFEQIDQVINQNYSENLSLFFKSDQGPNDQNPSTLIDYSGNQNHGTINGPTWVDLKGCTDNLSCNYNEDATVDDGSCTYAEENFDCDGNCLVAVDCQGVCGGNSTNPNLSLSLSELAYNVVVAEESNQSKTLTITNDGDCDLDISINQSEQNFALSFDGIDDYVNLGNFNSYNLNGPMQSFTVNVKAKVGEFPDFTESYIIGTPMFGGNSDRGFKIQANRDQSFSAVVGGNNSLVIAGSNENTIQNDRWYDITMVLDQGQLCGECGGDSLFFYIDSYLVDVVSISPIGTINNEFNINLGAFFVDQIDYFNAPFNGFIDNVSIWNYAFSREQVEAFNYNSIQGNYDELLSFWSMNEGEGDNSNYSLTDNSGNGNDGTIYGATWQLLEQEISLPDWLSCNFSEVTIASGDSFDLECEVDVNGLEAGDYISQLSLSTNDPNNGSITVPVSLNVGKPTIAAEIPSGDFGELEFNASADIRIPVSNSGNMPLTINLSELTAPLTLSESLSLNENESGEVMISLTCGLEEDEVNQTLILTTNDSYNESITLDLSGACVPTSNPIIVSAIDVPDDQGGYILLEFTRSYFDDEGLRPSEYYTIERYEDFGTGSADWIGIFTQAAYADIRYSVIVPTSLPVDSPEVTAEFRVVAAMDEGPYSSNLVEVTSIDNLNPNTPENLETTHSQDLMTLSWTYEQDSDFLNHRIEELCEDDYTIENFYTDDIDNYNQYQVFSNDFSGNSSGSEDVMIRKLNEGNNLVSFSVLPDLIGSSLNDVFKSIDGTITGVIGEGVAASPHPILGWVGSLNTIEPCKGYWVRTNNTDVLFVIGQDIEECTLDLHSGQNLVGYPYSYPNEIQESMVETYESYVDGIIGEGVAASPHPILGWIGSLSELKPTNGYWINIEDGVSIEEFYFEGCDSFDCGESSCNQAISTRSMQSDVPDEMSYVQSMYQAFYFLGSIELNGYDITYDDYIASYCNNEVVGYRKYAGPYTDIPVMGNDGTHGTELYCEEGSLPHFKLFKSSGEIINLSADIPVWSNNTIYTIETMTSISDIPQEYSLSEAYPNPFNPSTTIDFSVPTESLVNIGIYDVSGRNIQMLVNDTYQPGYYSIVWDAKGHSSGVYFVKMTSGSYTQTQKLMLVK